jgi:hypothetical protein
MPTAVRRQPGLEAEMFRRLLRIVRMKLYFRGTVIRSTKLNV